MLAAGLGRPRGRLLHHACTSAGALLGIHGDACALSRREQCLRGAGGAPEHMYRATGKGETSWLVCTLPRLMSSAASPCLLGLMSGGVSCSCGAGAAAPAMRRRLGRPARRRRRLRLEDPQVPASRRPPCTAGSGDAFPACTPIQCPRSLPTLKRGRGVGFPPYDVGAACRGTHRISAVPHISRRARRPVRSTTLQAFPVPACC